LPHVFEQRVSVDAMETRTVRVGDRHPDHFRQPIVEVALVPTYGASAGVADLVVGRRMNVLVSFRVELLLPVIVIGGSKPPFVVPRGIMDRIVDRL